MKKANFLTIAVLSIVLLLGANLATALEPIPKESGFGGFLRPGVGYLNYKSNMVASFLGFDLSDKKTNSLDDSPDSQSTGIVLVPFSLQYTFASTRTQLFLGTDLTDLIRFDYAQQFGVKQEIGKLGLLQGGVLFSGIPAKVWKDPYVVDKNRDDTSRTSNGGRIAWDRIFGSHLQLQYTYRRIDVSSEKSGDFLGLTSSQRKLLKRDGDRHIGEVVYRFRFAQKHTLNPAFIYTNDDRDGDAMKNDAYDFQLTYGYIGDTFAFTGNASIGWADYDDKNPIYDKKQDDDRYGIQGTLYWENPWKWSLLGSNPMNFFIGGAYAKTNANIDFYDQEAIMGNVGVFLKW
jgi:opacity protein-like surface antigen